MPDFAEFYHLRFTHVVETYPPMEVLLLIAGLPSQSRLAGRLAGETHYRGWDQSEWLLLDMRNTMEGIRSGFSSKSPFREFTSYPGYALAREKQIRKKMSALRGRIAGAGQVDL